MKADARSLLALSLLWPWPTMAEWQISASLQNSDGYRFEIYRSADDTVRARFLLNGELSGLDALCPTYQVDSRDPPRNSSPDGEACSLQTRSADFIVGRIDGNRLVSPPLYELRYGKHIHFRFKREAGGYGQTSFKLKGFKSMLPRILGPDLEVVAH